MQSLVLEVAIVYDFCLCRPLLIQAIGKLQILVFARHFNVNGVFRRVAVPGLLNLCPGIVPLLGTTGGVFNMRWILSTRLVSRSR
jgi:hypothetical protein